MKTNEAVISFCVLSQCIVVMYKSVLLRKAYPSHGLMDAGITLNMQPEEYRLLTCSVSEGLWENAINKCAEQSAGLERRQPAGIESSSCILETRVLPF